MVDWEGPPDIQLPLARARKTAEEWALVLTAEQIPTVLHRTEGGYALEVPPESRDRALQILEAWREENRPGPAAPDPPPLAGPGHLALAYLTFLGLLAFHVILESTPRDVSLTQIGSAMSERILRGEWWRIITALCLHQSAGHVIGNTLIGGLFFGALARRIGSGLALAATLASGAFGNLANAIYYEAIRSMHHSSIGASTSVFGIVGILSAIEAFRRRGISLTWRRSWVPLGGGLGLLAMLGSGEGRVDVSAHLFGLLSGMAIGAALAPVVNQHRPGNAIQSLWGIAAVAVVAIAWQAAGL